MEAVILAAGEGRKLRPLTVGMPKVMLPVGNRPILEYVVEALVKNDIRDIVIVIGYFGEKIKRYFGDGRDFGARIRYVVQKKQLGTAHALYQARGLDDFIVVPGDNMVSEACIREIRDTAPNTILAMRSSRASKYGVVELEKYGGVRIIEKPQNVDNSLIFSGIAHLSGEVFEYLKDAIGDEIYALPAVLSKMNVGVRMGTCDWRDAVYPWDLLRLNSYALGQVSRRVSGKIEQCTIVGNVEIGTGSVIGAGTYIKGPVKIGENVTVGPNSVIMPDTAIGDGVSLGAQSYVENSVIMGGATLGVGCYVKDSVLGPGVHVQPRVSMLSGKFTRVISGEILSEYGGSAIGPRAEIGASSVIMPGMLVGADSKVSTLKSVSEDVANEESVR